MVRRANSGTARTLKRPCRGTNQAGNPCGAAPLRGEDWCKAHQPGAEAEWAERSSDGGRSAGEASESLQRTLQRDVGTHQDLLELVMQVIREVAYGSLAASQGGVIAVLLREARALLDAVGPPAGAHDFQGLIMGLSRGDPNMIKAARGRLKELEILKIEKVI